MIELCACGHGHLSGDQCWCGCTRFTPPAARDLVGVVAESLGAA